MIIGNLRMCLSMAGLIQLSRSTNQAWGIMVLIYNSWGGNLVWTWLIHSQAQRFLRYALCLPLSNNMEHLRVDVSHNLLPNLPDWHPAHCIPDLSLEGALLAIWASVVNTVATLYHAGN